MEVVLAIVNSVSLRGWFGLLVAITSTALLAGDAFSFIIGPRYVDVPLRSPRVANEATLELDRHGIQWQLDEGGALKVEAPRAEAARSALRNEGVLAVARQVRSRADEPTYDARLARELERETNMLLHETIGADRARVAVSVELDLDRRTERRLRYGRRRTPIRRRLDGWRLRGDFARGDGRYEALENGVDRAVRSTRFAIGAVERVSAALIVDPDVARQDVRALRQATAAALGIDRRRGDVLRVSRVEVGAPDRDVARRAAVMFDEVPWVLLVIGVSLFMLEVGRCLRRSRRDAPPAPRHAAGSSGSPTFSMVVFVTSYTLSVITIGIDPTIEIGPITLAWHGITIALGILVGSLFAARLARQRGFSSDPLYGIAVVVTVAGLLGGKIFYLVETGRITDPGEWLDSSGFTFNGGLILATIGIALYLRRTGTRATYLDVVALAFPVGVAVGRIGDVINGEHYGPASTSLLAVRNTHPDASVPSADVAYHSGGLYEVLIALVIFAIVWPQRRGFTRPLSAVWTVIALFAVGRFLEFFYRDDSDNVALGLNGAQWTSVVLVAVSAAGLAYGVRRWPPRATPLSARPKPDPRTAARFARRSSG